MIKLKTKRIELRHLEPGDAPAFFSYRSDPIANKYQGWIPKIQQDALEFIRYRVTDKPNIPDTWIQLAIVHIEENKVIGDLGVYFHPDDPKEVKLGYTLDRNYWGQAYATEALRLLIDHLVITYGKTRFIALISPENTASIKLIKRFGFIEQKGDIEPELIDSNYPDDLPFILNITSIK